MIPPLLVITPPAGPVQGTVVEVAGSLGIAVTVLLREPGVDPARLLEDDSRLAELRRAALGAGLPVLLSCRSDDAGRLVPLARAAGLSGLQLKGDPPEDTLLRARAAWPGGILGASVHGEARSVSADYVVFAPVFAPGTAAGFPKPAKGCEALGAWARMHARTVALGGVTAQTAEACVRAGAWGLAGISTFLGPREAVADTLRALAGALTLRPDVPPSPRG